MKSNNLLAPIYPLDALEKILWPDLSYNPHLNYEVKQRDDLEFTKRLNQIITVDRNIRSQQNFKDWRELSFQSQCFIEKGLLIQQIDTTNLLRRLQSEIEELQKRKPVRDKRNYDRSKFLPNIVKLVSELFDKHGLSEAASNMIGFSVKVNTVVLHMSDENDVHYKQVLSDCNYNTRLQLLHRDPKPNIKALLYLKDVSEIDGPFKFIQYSHRWACPYIERMSSQANCTYNYLDSKSNRDKFLALPKQNRLTSIIGSVLDDDDPLSKKLCKREIDFTSNLGNVILFPASGLLHRGGACNKNGTRINLQITLK